MASVVKTLLKIYLTNGTSEFPSEFNRDLKLLNVGLLVKKVGGNRYNSSIGLKAVTTRYTSGKAVKATKSVRKTIKIIDDGFTVKRCLPLNLTL